MSASTLRVDSLNSHAEGKDRGQETAESTIEAYRKDLENDLRLKAARGLHPIQGSLSLAWNHLSVRGLGGKDEVVYGDTLGSLLTGPFGSRGTKTQQARIESGRGEEGNVRHDVSSLKKGERFLLHDLGGVVKAGEMMLVLGRPGAGATTFLKTAAAITGGYAGVDGEVLYGNITSTDKKRLNSIRGQIVYNSDEEVHLPHATVSQTLTFALANNTPNRESRPFKKDEATVPTAAEVDAEAEQQLLKIFGLSHTADTKVGDSYVRGVSGGQRKRVSLAEVLAGRPSVQLWDKPTRGLDANTALEFIKILRVLADVQRNAIVVSLYQAGNVITNLFDKILVLAEGETIYYGPQAEAKPYMESLGFQMLEGANVSDFLTGVTAVKERKIRSGFPGRVPTTVAEFAEHYKHSSVAERMRIELHEHLRDTSALNQEVEDTYAVVEREKQKGAIKSQPYTVSMIRQIKVALKREFQQRTADKFTFWARQLTTSLMSLVVGSVFYNISPNTSGFFLRGGAALLSFIFPSLLALAETTAAFEGRPILQKHNGMKLFRPTSLVIAQTLADIPLLIPSMVIYGTVIYWMAGFKSEAGPFFIYLLFIYLCVLAFSGFFRMVGAAFPTFEDASKASGFGFTLLATYNGYFITTPSMKPWFSWARWLSPMYYALEATVSNELGGVEFPCDQLVPAGPGYTEPAFQGCTAPGAIPGATFVSGDDYLRVALRFYHSHIWRNFGIMVALWIAFVAGTALFSELLPPAGSKKGYLLYKRGVRSIQVERAKSRAARQDRSESQDEDLSSQDEKVLSSNSIFTWKNLDYTVRANGQDLKLLDNVQGWCKPGQLTALMGASGAGKTTLLDVLAQRKDSGEVTGEVLINGQPLPLSFQRTTGYAEQLDIHQPQATVREALEFSARLRQPRSVSDKDKLSYVDKIIDLLELHDIEDALIGVPGAGLGVEQRKRLTIGVELVARPRLLFADEPTSGLDGQSAYTIVTFLRKLADAGQSVLVTIHQPSASLFAVFDSLLLLKAGGKTVFFGDTATMPEYFAAHGIPFPRDVNPAEYMIDVVSGEVSRERDWSEVWLNSEQHRFVVKELERLKLVNKRVESSNRDDGYEFAASTMTQLRLVQYRASTQIYRQVDYVVNKIVLHISIGLLNGFSWWMIKDSVLGLQDRMFTSFAFLFVAPGVIAQMQPKFIANRDIYENREKKAKMYRWQAFITAEIIAELPYLIICGTLFAVCWLPPTGISFAPKVAGPIFLEIYLYELLYTGIGQSIAAYSPTATAAATINPIIVGTLVTFNGAFIPYNAIQAFWRYWLYWLDPFKYVMGALLIFPLWDQKIACLPDELGRFAPPPGQTCGAYMENFLANRTGYLVDPDAIDLCEYCVYRDGSEYLKTTLNYAKKIYGWRELCITLIFVISSYGLVYGMMRLRTKPTRAAVAKGKEE